MPEFDPFWPIRRGMFWLKEAALGRNTRQVLRQIEADALLSPDARRAKQWMALQQVVRRAAHEVPLYRALWSGVDIDAALASPEAFAERIPILERETFASAGERMVSPKGRGRIVPGYTSGSTFSKIVFQGDRRGTSGSAAARVLARRRWGVREGAKEYRLQRRPWGAMMSLQAKLRYASRRLGSWMTGVTAAQAILTGPEDIARRCQSVRRLRPQVLYGSGGVLMALADYVVRAGRQEDFASVQAVIYMAEPVGDAGHDLLADAFGAPVICDYTCNEMGLLAFDCPDGCLHLNDDCVWFETVDDAGRPVHGKEGHLVVTRLVPSRTPLVRYRLGDMATLAMPGVTCACGNPQRVLDQFQGRTVDRIRRPDGTYLGVLAAVNVALPVGATHWYTRLSAGHRLTLVLEIPAHELAPHRDRVLAQFQQYAGPDMVCSIEAVDRIDPMPNGKYARVIREPGWDKEA